MSERIPALVHRNSLTDAGHRLSKWIEQTALPLWAAGAIERHGDSKGLYKALARYAKTVIDTGQMTPAAFFQRFEPESVGLWRNMVAGQSSQESASAYAPAGAVMSFVESAPAKHRDRKGHMTELTEVKLPISALTNGLNLTEIGQSLVKTIDLVARSNKLPDTLSNRLFINQTATATLWTPTNTAIPSDTPTPTFTPTNTFTPTATFTPSITPSFTPTPTPTATLTPSMTPSATPVAYQISAQSNINARACPELDCEIVTAIEPGELILIAEIVDGATVSGSDEWLFGNYSGEDIYVHTSLAARFIPPTPTRQIDTSQITTYYVNSTSRVNIRSCASTNCEILSGANRGDRLQVIDSEGDWQRILLPGNRVGFISSSLTNINRPPTLVPRPAQPVQPVQPAQPAPPVQSIPQPTQAQQSPAPAPQFSCSCSKTCGQMASCQEAYFQLNECGCGRRDGDNDGVPCESICSGG